MKNGIEIFDSPHLIDSIPKEPGVYVIRSNENEILYIGKAKDLRKRVKTYLNPTKLDIFKSSMVREAKFIETIVVSSELEALLLESNMIKEYRPPYNVVLRDDKSYPYLRISFSEKYPRLFISRRIKNRKDFYFGPITPADKLKKLIKLFKSSYKIAQKNGKECQGTNSACIYYQMGRCSAPCVGYISHKEYMNMIREIKNLLTNPAPVKLAIQNELKECVEKENFERAIELRDKLKAIDILEDRQSVSEINEKFLDVIVFDRHDMIVCVYIINIRFSNMVGSRKYFLYDSNFDNEQKESFIIQYYSFGELIPDVILTDGIENPNIIAEALGDYGKKPIIKTPKKGKKLSLIKLAYKNASLSLKSHVDKLRSNLELFEKTRNAFGFKKTPYIIDVVDISHTSFENVVGGVVRYSINGFEKDMYRRYSLSSKFEYESMLEVLKRHKQLLLKGHKKLPDIIIVDGGTIQVEAAKKAFKKYKIIGIAKDKKNGIANRNTGDVEDRIYFNGTTKRVNRDVLMFFQKLRDEAHRFVISYHRIKREKYVISSILDRIEFIGTKRKRDLFDRFSTIDNIKNASVEELIKIKGITPKIAEAIKEKLNSH